MSRLCSLPLQLFPLFSTTPTTQLPLGYVIHGTNGLTLSDNVAFHASGSCFYIEVGIGVRVAVGYYLIHTECKFQACAVAGSSTSRWGGRGGMTVG